MADYKPKIVFDGDVSGAIGAVNRLKSELNNLESLAKKAFTFSVAGYSIKSVLEFTKSLIDQGDELNKMSQKTGIAVDELSKYRYIADLSGVSNEALTKGLTALAVGMTSAATGVGDTADEYKKFGINVRNVDGTMKTSGAVLLEWADKFAAMPDGVAKTNLAVDIFGKKLGAEMIPMLNLGAAGIKAMGDEAESLGLVIGADMAKRSEEFNDNLERMGKLSNAAGMEIGNALIPSLNELMSSFLSGKKAGLGFWESIGLMADGMVNLQFVMDDTEKKLAKLKGQLEDKKAGKFSGLGNIGVSAESIQKEIDTLEKRMAAYKAIQDKAGGDGVQTAEQLAAKRVLIESQLQTKLAELAKLHAIAEGKVSDEILKTDKQRTEDQIKNVEKWIASVSSAWQKSVKEAAAAGEEVKKLLDQAVDVRQNAADKAAAKRRGALSPEDQQRDIQGEFDKAAASAAYNAALSANAYLHTAEMPGRAAAAAKLAEQAVKDAERAVKLADQIDDPEAGAKAVERAAEIQASLLEQKAKAKQEEQRLLEADVHVQEVLLANLDAQLESLQTKASAIKVEADIKDAEGNIRTLQAQLDNLKDKTITVTVNQVGSADAPLGGASPSPSTDPLFGFAWGGWTGPGGKWQPAGFVHAEEFVNRREVVRQPGALAFLTRFNQIGMAALNGYASGGLVQNIRVPSLPAPVAAQESSGTPITLVLDGRQYPVTATRSVASELTTLVQREVLKRGSPR